jgi:hypothetical protein
MPVSLPVFVAIVQDQLALFGAAKGKDDRVFRNERGGLPRSTAH